MPISQVEFHFLASGRPRTTAGISSKSNSRVVIILFLVISQACIVFTRQSSLLDLAEATAEDSSITSPTAPQRILNSLRIIKKKGANIRFSASYVKLSENDLLGGLFPDNQLPGESPRHCRGNRIKIDPGVRSSA